MFAQWHMPILRNAVCCSTCKQLLSTAREVELRTSSTSREPLWMLLCCKGCCAIKKVRLNLPITRMPHSSYLQQTVWLI